MGQRLTLPATMRVVAVVNEKARRGGPAVARALKQALPRAEVVVTRSLADLDDASRGIAADPPDLLLGAGGDGTAIALLNSLRRAAPPAGTARRNLVRMGLLRLGTGNGWARALGAPPMQRALQLLRRADELPSLPLKRFDLVEVEGLVAHFAGTGWDAELIDDFHAQKTGPSVLPRRVRYGLGGYLNGLLTRAVPRNLRLPRVQVEVANTGSSALGIDARGRAFELPFTAPGEDHSILYRGPVSVCAVGTAPEWGFGFRAFPFAGLVRGRFNLRMFVGTTGEALARVPLLWSGKHPLDKMLTWLLTSCEVRFSRHVPFQVGGDLLGHFDRIRYGVANDTVDVLDWRALERELEPRRLPQALGDLIEPALSSIIR
ncbi:MAG: diacylglycerol kinase [Polyangiaceae bacterium]|nr:diacylglycerol kinase [Polyangiaceae bacterium]